MEISVLAPVLEEVWARKLGSVIRRRFYYRCEGGGMMRVVLRKGCFGLES